MNFALPVELRVEPGMKLKLHLIRDGRTSNSIRATTTSGVFDDHGRLQAQLGSPGAWTAQVIVSGTSSSHQNATASVGVETGALRFSVGDTPEPQDFEIELTQEALDTAAKRLRRTLGDD